MRGLQRLQGPICLGLLAPLVAEYLLGDLMITQPGAFPVTALIYGGGAVLIREAARRSGGWPSFVCLALAYALLEEGVADQSLFNPAFMHQHLLAYGYWPALGTAAPWAINVVVLHVVWSLAVPIGMAECLFPERRTAPWLGPLGLCVTALLFLAGVSMITAYFMASERVHASGAQLGACAVLILTLVAAAFSIARLRRGRPRPAPVSPLSLGVAGFLAGSAFVTLYGLGQTPALASGVHRGRRSRARRSDPDHPDARRPVRLEPVPGVGGLRRGAPRLCVAWLQGRPGPARPVRSDRPHTRRGGAMRRPGSSRASASWRSRAAPPHRPKVKQMTEKISLCVELHYKDPDAALAWLEAAFGFRTRMRVADEAGRLVFAETQFGGQVVAVIPERPGLGVSPKALNGIGTATLQVRMTDDVDAHCARARAAGAEI